MGTWRAGRSWFDTSQRAEKHGMPAQNFITKSLAVALALASRPDFRYSAYRFSDQPLAKHRCGPI
jgi:hypothetical protein